LIQLFHSIAILGIVDGERSQRECIMKIFTVAALALVTGLSISTSANAQQTVVRLGDETAIQMANRIAACRQPGIAGARYTDGGRMLRVRCVGGAAGVDGMAGGLGAGVAAGVVAIIVAAALGSDGDSTTGTTGTTSTTGTN
jgi:Zn-dependent protease